jgi:hypothetical protein
VTPHEDRLQLSRLLLMARTKGVAAVFLLQLRKGMKGVVQPGLPPPPGTPREFPVVYRVELNDLESYLVNSLMGAT